MPDLSARLVLQQAGFSVARWLRPRGMQPSHLADGAQCVYEGAVAVPPSRRDGRHRR
jgi:hypothetical protein